MPTRLITADTVDTAFARGDRRIVARRGEAVVSPGAWTRAGELEVEIVLEAASAAPETPSKSAGPAFAAAPAKPPADDKGSADRTVDKSGLVLVRGHSVRLGKFTGAGPAFNIGLTDLITSRDGAPMTAGIMSWAREDSFPWSLDYDEVDLVLEGILQITIDGRTLEGRAGDVFYIPKGSSIRFGTPSRTRVFYVTYPADWSSPAPARPQK